METNTKTQMKKTLLGALFTLSITFLFGQFHTVKIPKASPPVIETQRIGVTDITVSYHTPAVKGRDVWSRVVPFEGDPIPWRAGANMNTTIAFTTDIEIEGKPLPAGSYGFHVIPRKEGGWSLLFANHDNQWGSYYLNLEKDIALEVLVDPVEANFSEQLDFEFMDRTENTVIIGLEWAEKRIPFKVSVDLNRTVVENFRYELMGINTYQWEAWNDAAKWCLSRNTNLEEALSWANRSIEGGYNGFSANSNFENLSTKAAILWALGRTEESDKAVEEAISKLASPYPVWDAGEALLKDGREVLAISLYDKALTDFGNEWYIQIGYSRVLYKTGNKKKALKIAEKVASKNKDESYQNFVAGLIDKMINDQKI